MSNVEIKNPENSLLVSDVLAELVQLADRQGAAATVHDAAPDQHKGEILNAIALGMTSSAAYELLKSIVLRFASRKDYDGAASVVVNGDVIVFGDLVSGVNRPHR